MEDAGSSQSSDQEAKARGASTFSPAEQIAIDQADIFSIPVFQIPVQEMHPYHDELIMLFTQQIRSGEIRAHVNGHGYQSKMNLFDTNTFALPYLRDVLMAAFHLACANILSKTITDFAPDLPHRWVNTFNAGWASIQTNEVWPVETPWHTHLPAMLSGCYYVTAAKQPGEGLLQFMNPNTPNIFQPKVGEIEPKAGHMLIFPSYLGHRPTPTPGNGDQVRLALCMDGHWTSRIGQGQGAGLKED